MPDSSSHPLPQHPTVPQECLCCPAFGSKNCESFKKAAQGDPAKEAALRDAAEAARAQNPPGTDAAPGCAKI